MANKQDVIDLHRAKPHLTAREIAKELNCPIEQVFVNKHRYGLKIPRERGKAHGPNSLLALGKEARMAGLTVEMIQRMREPA